MSDQEEQLSRLWLNTREKYDRSARSSAILNQAADVITRIIEHNVARPTVADLGCGTGNNVLFLHDHLEQSTRYVLVEQHHFLLRECRQRISNQLGSSEAEFDFNLSRIIPWLEENRADFLTNSALLDLFTESELRWLLHFIKTQEIPMYTSLNYRGVTFTPTDHHDEEMINLFEQHMSRELNRGRPLGASCCPMLETIVHQIGGLQESHADSDWSVPTSDTDFISMNLDFYENGIREVMTQETDYTRLDQWIQSKRCLLDDQRLSLTVHHRDYLITPFNNDLSST